MLFGRQKDVSMGHLGIKRHAASGEAPALPQEKTSAKISLTERMLVIYVGGHQYW
jgi:hypothetical protein